MLISLIKLINRLRKQLLKKKIKGGLINSLLKNNIFATENNTFNVSYR